MTPSPTPTDMHRSMGKVPLDSQAPQAYTARHANSNSNANLNSNPPRGASDQKRDHPRCPDRRRVPPPRYGGDEADDDGGFPPRGADESEPFS